MQHRNLSYTLGYVTWQEFFGQPLVLPGTGELSFAPAPRHDSSLRDKPGLSWRVAIGSNFVMSSESWQRHWCLMGWWALSSSSDREACKHYKTRFRICKSNPCLANVWKGVFVVQNGDYHAHESPAKLPLSGNQVSEVPLQIWPLLWWFSAPPYPRIKKKKKSNGIRCKAMVINLCLTSNVTAKPDEPEINLKKGWFGFI